MAFGEDHIIAIPATIAAHLDIWKQEGKKRHETLVRQWLRGFLSTAEGGESYDAPSGSVRLKLDDGEVWFVYHHSQRDAVVNLRRYLAAKKIETLWYFSLDPVGEPVPRRPKLENRGPDEPIPVEKLNAALDGTDWWAESFVFSDLVKLCNKVAGDALPGLPPHQVMLQVLSHTAAYLRDHGVEQSEIDHSVLNPNKPAPKRIK